MLVKCPKCKLEYEVPCGKYECACGAKFIVSDKGVALASQDDANRELSASVDFVTSTPCGPDEKTRSRNYPWLALAISLTLLIAAGAAGAFAFYRHKVSESNRREIEALKVENSALKMLLKKDQNTTEEENKRPKDEKSLIEASRPKDEKQSAEASRPKDEKQSTEAGHRPKDEKQPTEAGLRPEDEKQSAEHNRHTVQKSLQNGLIFSAAHLSPCPQNRRDALPHYTPRYHYAIKQPYYKIYLNMLTTGMTYMFSIANYSYAPKDVFWVNLSKNRHLVLQHNHKNRIYVSTRNSTPMEYAGSESFYCPSLEDGNPHTILVAASSEDVAVYVDGKYVGSRSEKGFPPAAIADYISTYADVDNVKLWNRRLTENEIHAAFDADRKNHAQTFHLKTTPHTLSSNIGPNFTLSQSSDSDMAYLAMDSQNATTRSGCKLKGEKSWWQISFINPIAVNKIMLNFRATKRSNYQHDNKSMIFQGSEDGVHWTELNTTRSSSASWGSGTGVDIEFEVYCHDNMPYRNYRLVALEELTIDEIEMIYEEMPTDNGKAAERWYRSKMETASAQERNVAKTSGNTSALPKVKLDSENSITIEIGVDNGVAFNFSDGALVATNYNNVGTHPKLKHNNKKLYFGRPACYVNGKIWELNNSLKISPTPIRIRKVKLLHSGRKSVSVSQSNSPDDKSPRRRKRKGLTATTSRNHIVWTPHSINIRDTEFGPSGYRIRVYFDTI